MSYKLYKTMFGQDGIVFKNNQNQMVSFVLGLNNPEEKTFKKAVLEGAELQDAEGKTMSAEQATQFVKELP